MALINLRFVCLMSLLLISTTCLTSQVSARNNILGQESDICGKREPYQYDCTQQGCVTACKKAGCPGGICHKDGTCNCLR